jgi:hypothetical protein
LEGKKHLKELILKQFVGQYCTLGQIADFIITNKTDASRNTIIWNIGELVKQNLASRVGRGVYSFNPKPQFEPKLGDTAKKVCRLIFEKFKYLDVTVTDLSILGEFMNLLPFVSVVTLEIKKSATNAVLSVLRKNGVDAYMKLDYPNLEKYVSTATPVIIRPELTVIPRYRQVVKCTTQILKRSLLTWCVMMQYTVNIKAMNLKISTEMQRNAMP